MITSEKIAVTSAYAEDQQPFQNLDLAIVENHSVGNGTSPGNYFKYSIFIHWNKSNIHTK